MYKSLLIVFLIHTCIEKNNGMYHGDNDDDDIFSQFDDFSGGPPSPGENMFRELYGTSEQYTNVETHTESSTANTKKVLENEEAQEASTEENTCCTESGLVSLGEEMMEELFGTPEQHTNEETRRESSSMVTKKVIKKKKAEKVFLKEFKSSVKKGSWKSWEDLRNKTYNQSWSPLCHALLYNEATEEKEKKSCSGKPMSIVDSPNLTHRVYVSSYEHKMYADLLRCDCIDPPVFYVTKCHMSKFPNYYYIMRLAKFSTLVVLDMRYAIFNPGYIHDL